MTHAATKTQSAKRFGAAIAALAAAFALSACGERTAQQRFVIKMDGSSTVAPISKLVAEEFNATAPQGLQVTVAESGTGGGFAKFCVGATQVQNASRPITASEMAECAANGVRYIELPVGFDALTVVVHPENPLTEISVAQLAKMWGPKAEGDEQGVGKIVNWREVDPKFPDLPLKLYGPGTASGTFDYFTEAVIGEAGASRRDFFPTENDNNIVLGVTGDKGALGYFGLSYFLANSANLKALAVKAEGAAAAVQPSVENVANGTYAPLARPLFIYVNAAELEKAPVRDFVNFYLNNAERIVASVDYVPLPTSAYQAALKRVEAGTVGTAFAGKAAIGASIEKVLADELTLDAAAAQAAPAAPTAQ